MIYKYAKAGGPPDCWHRLQVFDRETGKEIDDVVEVNADEGWLIKHDLGPDGIPLLEGVGDERRIKTVRVEGLFEIRQRGDA